ncbi:hypothetical protein P171DRAFT_508628 [Karstenula rhodostoma CBS 690.94]|uniref:Uncharacterized protein n=1 Tax=Karstenula rhodostoma CBS 690.94 TaxID=1392251 RepID=A0A9P4PSA9_9PLEO|nr:hypothetical protein P171DRAFT_508628 [Karstenula rhodostoma CBS 690.94]
MSHPYPHDATTWTESLLHHEQDHANPTPQSSTTPATAHQDNPLSTKLCIPSAPTAEAPDTPATTTTPTSPQTTHTLQALRQDTALFYRLHVFIHDLRAFRSNASSRARLDAVLAPDYIGRPYFSDAQAAQLRSTVVDEETGETLGQRLDCLFTEKLAKKLEKGGAWRVCAAHDLAPVFEGVVGVRPGELGRDKGFVGLVRKGGLDAVGEGGVWKGVGRR